jgi:hypothetical protein
VPEDTGRDGGDLESGLLGLTVHFVKAIYRQIG